MLLDFILKRDTNSAYFDFLDELNSKTAYQPLANLIKNSECPYPICVQEVDCQETLVLGNFPKLPPYYIERTSKVSAKNFFGAKTSVYVGH